MGCFNQSCVISRLDIQRGEKCALIPIIANRRSESLNDHCFRLFRPFCLPIFGVYDDYGGIEKIRRDKNVELIEKYFEISIDAFVDCVTHRRELYGEASQIQEAYGKPKCLVTRDSLAEAGFITQPDGTVIHPRIQKTEVAVQQEYLVRVNSLESENPTVAAPKFTTLKWDEQTLTLSGYYKDVQRYKGSSNASDVLGVLHAYLVHLKTQLPFSNKEEFIFCIPDEKQVRARLLLQFKDTFIREDVHSQISTRYAQYLSKNRGNDIKGCTQEFKALIKRWQKHLATYQATKPLADKCTVNDRMKRMDLYDRAYKPDDLWYHPYVDAFKTTRTGEEFLFMYGKELINPEILKQLVEFFHVQAAMIHGNILLIDSNSLEQHGDIEAQMELAGIFFETAKKIQKARL